MGAANGALVVGHVELPAPLNEFSVGTSRRNMPRMDITPRSTEEKKIRENQRGNKARWSDEGKRLLVRREAQLQFDGERTGQPVTFINLALEIEIPNRTRDSIQSIRKKQVHNDLVSRFLIELRQQDQAEGPCISEPHSPPTQQLREEDENILRRYVSNLGPIDIGDHRKDYLNAIGCHSRAALQC